MNALQAFRRTIAYGEGTDKPGQKTKNHGYDVIVGGSLFTDFSDHPRKMVDLPNLKIKSSAAGRYQILKSNYDHYKKQLNLPDFSPASQDAICDQLIRECRAMGDICNGNIESALIKCNSRWASLPGNKDGQRQEQMSKLLEVYHAALAE